MASEVERALKRRIRRELEVDGGFVPTEIAEQARAYGLMDSEEGAAVPEELEEEHTYEELYELAQELNIKGRSSMTKEELAEAVAAAQAE